MLFKISGIDIKSFIELKKKYLIFEDRKGIFKKIYKYPKYINFKSSIIINNKRGDITLLHLF